MRVLRLKKFIVLILAFIILPTAFVLAGNPVTPILPSDNIQDPGDPGTAWGGCGPSDSNCYVTVTNWSFTNGLTNSSGTVRLGGNLTQNTIINSGSFNFGIRTTSYPLNEGMFQIEDGQVVVGDGDNQVNGTYIDVDDPNEEITINTLNLVIGDTSGNGNESYLSLDDASQLLEFHTDGNEFFVIDVGGAVYQLGDIDSINNGTYFTVDDSSSEFVFSGGNIVFPNTAGGDRSITTTGLLSSGIGTTLRLVAGDAGGFGPGTGGDIYVTAGSGSGGLGQGGNVYIDSGTGSSAHGNIVLDPHSGVVSVGDVVNTDLIFQVTDGSKIYSGVDLGNKEYFLGDSDNVNLFIDEFSFEARGDINDTRISLDDSNKSILLRTEDSTDDGNIGELELQTGTTFADFQLIADFNDEAQFGYVSGHADVSEGYIIYDASTYHRFLGGNVGIGAVPTNLFSVGSSGGFQVNSSGAIAAATGIISSGTIQFSSLTTNGALYTSGGNGTLTTTAPTSGAIGYWSRSGTTLSPATANDIVSITGNTGDILTITSSATGSANKALNISQTGATAGTDYAGYFANSGAATTNVGLYTTASGASTNYALYAVSPGGASDLAAFFDSSTGSSPSVQIQNETATGVAGVGFNVGGSYWAVGKYGTGFSGDRPGSFVITSTPIFANGVDALRINTSREVFIGGSTTDAGTYILQVTGEQYIQTPAGQTGITLKQVSGGGAGNEPTISFSHNTSGYGSRIGMRDSDGGLHFDVQNASTWLDNALVIESGTGDIGIGAGTNPLYRLDVLKATTGQTASNRVANFSNAGATFNTTSGALSSYGGYFSSTSTESAGGNVLTNIGLYATASGADANYAAIFDAGNVGIGTTTPISKLANTATQITDGGNGVSFNGIQWSLSDGGYAAGITNTNTSAAAFGLLLKSESTAGPVLFVQGASNTNLFSVGLGGTIFNDAGSDIDFRIEGDTDANLFFIDASTNRIGIGDSSPASLLTVGSGDLFQVNSSGNILGVFANATTDTDRFLVSDSGTIKYRTGTELRSDIGAAGISGTPAANQIAFWDSSGTVKGSTTFTVSDALYPTMTIGSAASAEASLALVDLADTYVQFGASSGGATMYGSSTYRGNSFYSYAGGNLFAQFLDSAGVLTHDFKGRISTNTLQTGGSNLGAFNIDRTFAEASSGNNQHGYVDKTVFRYGGSAAFNAFYAENTIGATNAGYTQDHWAGFQTRITKDGANTVNHLYDFVALGSIVSGGTATNRYGYYMFDATNTATLTNQYAIYVPSLNDATNNWTLYSVDAPSYHGGEFRIGSSTDAGAYALQIIGSTYSSNTITDTGTLVDLNVTLGNDANVDTISALNIDVTSATTGDADIVYGINIGDVTAGDATVREQGLRIGTGWDYAAVIESGFVGIGGDPDAPLDITGDEGTSFNPMIEITNTDTDGYTQIGFMATGNTWSIGVGNNTETAQSIADDFFIYDFDQTAIRFVVEDTTGEIGIGDNTPDYLLDIAKTSTDGNIFSLTDSDGECLYNPESGAVTVSCSSDERLKQNIIDAGSALEYFRPFKVREYDVIASGDHMVGVIAQEVLLTNPELVTVGVNNMYSVQLPSQWQVVKALQELDLKILDIESLDANSSFTNRLKEWLGDVANGIERIFAKELKTEKLCITDNGGELCVTKSDLQNILNQNQGNNGGGSTPAPPTDQGESDPEEGSGQTEEVTPPTEGNDTVAPPEDSSTGGVGEEGGINEI